MHLYYGDNLEYMKTIQDHSVDLITTNPPYSANPNIKFESMWLWDELGQPTKHKLDEFYSDYLHTWKEEEQEGKNVHSLLHSVFECIDRLSNYAEKGEDGAFRTYMYFITIRILEMERILKPKGSFYLHVHHYPASYIRLICDAIFGRECLLREIVWERKVSPRGQIRTQNWVHDHDMIFFYVKHVRQKEYTFQKQFMPHPTKPGKEKAVTDVWSDLYAQQVTRKTERTPYPGQKPYGISDRIIRASSNEGDTVFDPFCGSGTTLEAAHALGRRWIGIDREKTAINATMQRIADRCNMYPDEDYKLTGDRDELTMPEITNIEKALF